MRIIESDLVRPGTVLVMAPGAFRLYEEGPVKIRRELGWRAEIREIVRDGMRDVLEWLGDNAPRELPDEDELMRRQVRMEQRLSLQVIDPRSMVRGIVAP